MKYFVYILYRFLGYFVKIIPFWLIYLTSDLFFIIFYYLIRYRRKVVKYNLTTSFPDKSEEEIKRISKLYYKHLCDILLESIKGNSMSKSEILKRHKLINPEVLESYYQKNESVILTPAHYNNWEWGTLSGGIQLKHKVVVFYQPIKNKFIDNHTKKTRSGFNTELVSASKASATFREYVKQTSVFLMTADQNPSSKISCHWTMFLNKKTSCFSGPEIYAKKYNLPVFYLKIKKVKRGFYEIELIPVALSPKDFGKEEITAKYMSLLEETIKENPEYWLWSHKRWKNIPTEDGFYNPYLNL